MANLPPLPRPGPHREGGWSVNTLGILWILLMVLWAVLISALLFKGGR
jgi:hypothetical protein